MNIKAATVFKSIKLSTQEMVVFMVLNDRSHSTVDIISVFTAASGGLNSLGKLSQFPLITYSWNPWTELLTHTSNSLASSQAHMAHC
jgi:hypothetical protein